MCVFGFIIIVAIFSGFIFPFIFAAIFGVDKGFIYYGITFGVFGFLFFIYDVYSGRWVVYFEE